MAGRHVVYESTKQAILEARREGESWRALAVRLGDERYRPALSSIVGNRLDVGREMERSIRVALGLPARELKPCEKHRAQLSKRLRAAGVTWTQALEIALDVVEG